MDKMNVCLINDSFPPDIDGVANAVTNYASIITRDLGSATVVCPENPKADDATFDFPIERYPSIDTTKLVGYRAGVPFSPDTLEALQKNPPDIIHSHCPITSTMLARSLRDKLNVPLVLTYHTKFDIDIENAIKGKLLQEEAKRLLAKNISACDEVWTVSRGAGENLHKLGYEGDYIVMPNGVDFPRGRVDDALIEQVTAGYDLPYEIPLFLFVGRMMWYKGIRISLEALKKLDDEGLDFRMVFVGGGKDKEEIVALTNELGLNHKVFFSEPIHDRNLIRAWYCRADMFLFPSTFDTNGLVVREAAACGLGSVLVEGSCAAEDVTDGRNGVLIEENSDSMAAKLRELMREPASMKRVGEYAQQEIYMSWDDAVKNAWNRYGIVIDNYRSGRYPAHETMTDEFFHSISDAMSGYSTMRAKRRRHVSELRSSYLELKDDIRLSSEKLMDEIRISSEKLADELIEFYDIFR